MTALDSERQEQARQYAREGRRLWLIQTLLSGVYVVSWVIFRWGVVIRTWLESQWQALANPWALVAAFALAFGAPFMVLELPLSYIGGFQLPHRFGQSTQSLRGWVTDQLKGVLVSAPIGLLLLELLYLCLRVAGERWWLWAAAGLLVFNVLLVNLAPVLIMPLFNRYIPLDSEHSELAQRLLELAHKAGTRVQGVYTFDLSRRTKAANAALTGMGATRRIILGDTLISEFTTDEVETVLAHELGHHVHGDMFVLIAAGAATTLAGLFLAAQGMSLAAARFGFTGVSDPAALPTLAMIPGVFGLLTTPLENAVSRWRERLADEYALAATGMNQAFASALTRLANQNLGEVDPERWVVWMFHSHPPLGERIKTAEAWGQQSRGA